MMFMFVFSILLIFYIIASVDNLSLNVRTPDDAGLLLIEEKNINSFLIHNLIRFVFLQILFLGVALPEIKPMKRPQEPMLHTFDSMLEYDREMRKYDSEYNEYLRSQKPQKMSVFWYYLCSLPSLFFVTECFSHHTKNYNLIPSFVRVGTILAIYLVFAVHYKYGSVWWYVSFAVLTFVLSNVSNVMYTLWSLFTNIMYLFSVLFSIRWCFRYLFS